MRAIIIDDEQKARTVLRTMLTENCPQVSIVAEVENVPNALKAIHTLAPDIIFLDIEMPGYSGLQLLEMIEKPEFQIIFTTAYSEYALQAFEVSAIDYLLKPIRIQKLINAVQKAAQMQGNHITAQRTAALQQNLKSEKWQKLVLPVSDGFIFLDFKDIEVLEAEGSYTRIHKTDGTHLLVTRLLRELGEKLHEESGFMRCHRSFIINSALVTRWQKGDGGSIIMQSGKEIPMNKDGRDMMQQLMGI